MHHVLRLENLYINKFKLDLELYNNCMLLCDRYHAWFVWTIQAECWEKNLTVLTCWNSCDEISWSYLRFVWSSLMIVRKTWSFIHFSFWYMWFCIECQIILSFYNSWSSTHLILHEILLHHSLLSELKTVILEPALNRSLMMSDEAFMNEKLR